MSHSFQTPTATPISSSGGEFHLSNFLPISTLKPLPEESHDVRLFPEGAPRICNFRDASLHDIRRLMDSMF